MIFNTFSPWWIIPCIALGLAYAWLLYRPNRSLPRLQIILFALRAFMVGLLAFLLLSPQLKGISRTTERPVIIIAQDNSRSILLDKKQKSWYLGEFPRWLRELEKELQDKYEVRSYHFSERPEPGIPAPFSGKQSDLGLLFKQLKSEMAGKNLGAIIFLSDGIYTKGRSPLYEMEGLNAPVYAIALGDTLAQKDLRITSVSHNQVAFLDNDFRIAVQVEARQLKGKQSRLRIRHQGQLVHQQTLNIGEDDFRVSLPLDIKASEKGRQKYQLSLQPIEGEISEKNNQYTFFIEVLDNRQQVLLLAAAAHPDIGAIREALESREQYEVSVYMGRQIPGDLSAGDYNLLILHQLPTAQFPLSKLPAGLKQLPTWYITGNQSDFNALNRIQEQISFSNFGGKYHDAYPLNHPDFYLFSLSENQLQRFAELPPLSSPLLNVHPGGNTVPLFSQRIGQLNSGRPLFLFSTAETQRTAWLFGEGLWRWRLHDFRENGDHDAIDGLINQTVQYLATREDTRRFRLNLPKEVLAENEALHFNAELYNESYQPVTEPDLHIEIRDETGKNYPFTFSKEEDRYHLNAGLFPPGDYRYSARVSLGNEQMEASGSFVVAEQQAEEMETRANHQLLYSMASRSGGELLYPDETGRLKELLETNETIRPVMYQQEAYRELLQLKWIFFLLLALLTGEWILRRYTGGV